MGNTTRGPVTRSNQLVVCRTTLNINISNNIEEESDAHSEVLAIRGDERREDTNNQEVSETVVEEAGHNNNEERPAGNGDRGGRDNGNNQEARRTSAEDIERAIVLALEEAKTPDELTQKLGFIGIYPKGIDLKQGRFEMGRKDESVIGWMIREKCYPHVGPHPCYFNGCNKGKTRNEKELSSHLSAAHCMKTMPMTSYPFETMTGYDGVWEYKCIDTHPRLDKPENVVFLSQDPKHLTNCPYPECASIYDGKAAMERHLRTHEKDSDRSCRDLGNFWWTLQIHVKKNGRSPKFGEIIRTTAAGWKCGRCNFFCQTEKGARNHLAQSHPDASGALRGINLSIWKGTLTPLFNNEAVEGLSQQARRRAERNNETAARAPAPAPA